ncbi:O-linked N-acetylglucosamine transferase, SPINDLY family protein [[Phormidium] sp. ETS-05]|uniref:O-linked N-acetylglucosamine transferase, SPINDLY family protein n=1 Tax=[Phormidium] sp. ETS-05 TaxID=222819 RepID=UPI0018EF33C2|nr:O-linked N-acetylglucosamine transferase, SPINDLY family protein [[Phormidium] sp. ETS-05]
MTSLQQQTDSNSWQEQAESYLLDGEYGRAAILYEQAIAAEPDVKSHYWHLGLMLLLQGKEEEATTTWLLAMVEGEPEQVELWTAELVEVLETEARRREELPDNSVAWLIRGHIREIQPTYINNLLILIELALTENRFTEEELKDWQVIELLQEQPVGSLDTEKLLQLLKRVLNYTPVLPSLVEFAAACVPHLQQHPNLLPVMVPGAVEIGYSMGQVQMGISLLEICRRVHNSDAEVLRHLAALYQNGIDYAKGIEVAKLCYELVETLPEKIFANHLRLRGWMSAGGYWEEALVAIEEQEAMVASLIEQEPIELPQQTVARLLTSAYFFPYFRDRARENRLIFNQLSHYCQRYYDFRNYHREQVERYYQNPNRTKPPEKGAPGKKLKIGYISYCMRSHSVGWLARWLLQHHDREKFEIYAYFVTYKYLADPLQDWYLSQVDYPRKLGSNNLDIAEQIYQDGIDILIDLDSLTMDVTCEVMALKPAPIQASWLGWDAAGMPTIDYFIADPYVLPEAAQDYYQEKIWRLPQTYIAVDGFEVGVPTWKRQDLDVPRDAVVYFSGQKGYKRHSETIRLQMKIIKEVPNSYFLIKGYADRESITSFFTQLAESEGVDTNRLRFLPPAPSEAMHRANLGIADVVLDTYPYNGATTTLETLWMGIPIVTRVGEQFAARNSYTMMMNVGVTEGIAWTDEEYVEWGIRLGKSPELREDIAWRLRQSRHSSPLWNAERFTRDMESAYRQMWLQYVDG